MKLYSGPLSLFTAKVRVALDEKGIAYQRVDVPFGRERGYEPKHPDVVALNPKQQVPVLVDGDLALYDSTLILEYLEDRHPEPALYPREPDARARCRQHEAASDEILFPLVWELIEEVFYQPDESARNAERVARATRDIGAFYGGLDAALADREWMCGEFSVADIAYFLTIGFAARLGVVPSPSKPCLGAWLARVAARPAVQREIASIDAYAARLAAPGVQKST